MDIQIIDKRKEIISLKSEFGGRYFAEPLAIKRAAEIWGATCNEHGVLLEGKEEMVVEIGRCNGVIKFAETSKGYWLIGLSGNTAIGGFGYAPSIWDQQGFASYDDARAFGIEKLIAYFEREAVTKNSCSSQSNKDNARKAAEYLKDERTPQLSLF